MANIEFKGGAKLKAALERIAKQAGKAQQVSVGFMAGATYPNGTSVAMVAALTNYGTSRMPARQFFSNMVREKSPHWGKSLASVLVAQKFDGEKALNAMGQGIGAQLQTSILDINSPPLAPSTIKRKGFDKVLIDTAHMINSTQYEVDNNGAQSLPKVAI